MNSQSVPSWSDCVSRKSLCSAGIELSDGLFFVDSRIALKPFHHRVKGKCQGFRQLRLAAARRPLNQNRLLQLSRPRTPGRA